MAQSESKSGNNEQMEKNEFSKNLCFVLIWEILTTVLGAYGVFLTGMKLKGYFGCILKTS